MPTASEYDRLINNKWKDAQLPEPTEKQAISGAKALWRKATGKPFHGKVEIVKRKNQYTWFKRGTYGQDMVVNPCRYSHSHIEQGWQEIVHSIAHMAHALQRPSERPHSDYQLNLEAMLTSYALSDKFKKYRG